MILRIDMIFTEVMIAWKKISKNLKNYVLEAIKYEMLPYLSKKINQEKGKNCICQAKSYSKK